MKKTFDNLIEQGQPDWYKKIKKVEIMKDKDFRDLLRSIEQARKIHKKRKRNESVSAKRKL